MKKQILDGKKNTEYTYAMFKRVGFFSCDSVCVFLFVCVLKQNLGKALLTKSHNIYFLMYMCLYIFIIYKVMKYRELLMKKNAYFEKVKMKI